MAGIFPFVRGAVDLRGAGAVLVPRGDDVNDFFQHDFSVPAGRFKADQGNLSVLRFSVYSLSSRRYAGTGDDLCRKPVFLPRENARGNGIARNRAGKRFRSTPLPMATGRL